MSSNIFSTSKKCKDITSKVSLYIVLVIIAIVTLAPLLWALSSSFRSNEEIFGSVTTFTIKSLIPEEFTFKAYVDLFTLRKFYMPVLNTMFVATVNILVGGLICSMAGFSFAKFNFRFKNMLFGLVMISVMVPFEGVAIPLYSLIHSFNWVDTYYALIVPGLANGLVIFLFKQFFEEIPDSLIESATIDGAGWITIFFKLMIPLSKPVIVSASLLIFFSQWEAFLWPLIAARGNGLKVIQVALTDFRAEHMTYWNELFAASVVAALIPTLLLMPFQKYYVQGVASSGMKE